MGNLRPPQQLQATRGQLNLRFEFLTARPPGHKTDSSRSFRRPSSSGHVRSTFRRHPLRGFVLRLARRRRARSPSSLAASLRRKTRNAARAARSPSCAASVSQSRAATRSFATLSPPRWSSSARSAYEPPKTNQTENKPKTNQTKPKTQIIVSRGPPKVAPTHDSTEPPR